MKLLENSFDAFSAPESYRRVDGVHPLDIYFGLDEKLRWSLLLICDQEPPALEASKMIFVYKGKRQDNRWAISLSLIDDTYKEIFLLFCSDIIDSSRHITDRKKGINFVAQRYKEWREMLANSRNNLLSPSEVKGLLGEMYFLLHCLAPMYGVEKAALSWTGPKQLPQDFIIDNTWYEVKTISSHRSEVTISSIEQLDCNCDGELVVIVADKSSITNERSINLNVIYSQLLNSIQSDSVKSDFSNLLFQFGYYPRQEYESSEYTFEIKDSHRYNVSSAFPCLRRNGLPASITGAEYKLSLPAVSEFEKE